MDTGSKQLEKSDEPTTKSVDASDFVDAISLPMPEEPSRLMPQDFDRMLLHAVANNASDITIQTTKKAMGEVYGKLHELTTRELTNTEVSEFLNFIYGQNATAQILGGTDVDTHYELKPKRGERYRFRVNGTGCLVNGHEGIQITLRTIPLDPPRLVDMQLNETLYGSLTPYQGIVVISGATGSGKSTLLSAIMRELLETRDGKILTYESPIEFVYDNVVSPRALISQHEIPHHLPDFPAAVRNALRRKPAYILVGEARDAETISAVIDAALTGHTVYTTVHANGVADTIRRMVSAFPAAERYGRTVDLISMMKAIVWQTLLPSNDGKRVAAREWLVFTKEIQEHLLKSDLG